MLSKLAADVAMVTVELRKYRVKTVLAHFHNRKKLSEMHKHLLKLLEQELDKKLKCGYAIDMLLTECELIMSKH